MVAAADNSGGNSKLVLQLFWNHSSKFQLASSAFIPETVGVAVEGSIRSPCVVASSNLPKGDAWQWQEA